ncbi:MAG: peptide chain release factor aRF-1 [Thaumarchaeota archaeon]|nr:peptide chain release factor aRF-1 [Nitrososphaerota archaeon]
MPTGDTSKKFDSVALYRIRKLLSDLSNKTGRGTELVSLYLPPKKAVHEAIAALREESGTASNIKSDTTRNHVQDALTKTMARLRLYKQTPENGIVIFCGAIPGPGGPGNESIELFEVLPQKPVSVYLYRCDDHFHLDPLRDMLREQNVIGILSMDATEAGLGIVSGDTWEVIDTMSSGVSGKTKKGGQSARRYERLREMELSDYFRRLADHSKKAFLEQYQIKGLIVSGPGPTKDEFVKDGYLDYRLQNAVVGTIDSGYTGREGVRETIEKAGKLLENVRVVEEKKLVQRFLQEVNSDSGLAIYGIKDILASLKRSAVETILVNDDVDLVYLKSSCKNCGNLTEKFVPRSQIVAEKQNMLTCPNCGSNEVEISERDVVDYLADVSIESGAQVEVISSKTEDGAMLKNFGGVSAILRYRG